MRPNHTFNNYVPCCKGTPEENFAAFLQNINKTIQDLYHEELRHTLLLLILTHFTQDVKPSSSLRNIS